MIFIAKLAPSLKRIALNVFHLIGIYRMGVSVTQDILRLGSCVKNVVLYVLPVHQPHNVTRVYLIIVLLKFALAYQVIMILVSNVKNVAISVKHV